MKQSQDVKPGSLTRLVSRIRQWWLHRQLMKACDESSKRMDKMSREERRQLGVRAREIMYPNGYWTCRNHGILEYNVPAGDACPVCNSANADIRRAQTNSQQPEP